MAAPGKVKAIVESEQQNLLYILEMTLYFSNRRVLTIDVYVDHTDVSEESS